MTGEDVNYRHDFGVRSKVVWAIGPETRLTMSGDYAWTKTDAGQARRPLNGPVGGAYGGYTFTGGFYDDALNARASDQAKSYGGYLRLEHDADAFKVVELASIRQVERHSYSDSDFTPVQIQTVDLPASSRSFSNELQILSPEHSTVSWIAGFYYFWSRASDDPLLLYTSNPTVPFRQIFSAGRTESLAGYAQATIPLFTDATRLTGGIRYTSDQKSVAATVLGPAGPILTDFTAQRRFSNWTYKIGIDHHITSDIMVYATYSTGFRAGQFGLTSPTVPAVEPEQLADIEGGIKSEFFDRRVRLNLSGFHYNYKNIQLLVIANGTTVLRNAARAEIYGMEGDAQVRIGSELRFNAGLSLQHSAYTAFTNAPTFVPLVNGAGALSSVDATGNKLLRTPDFTLNFGLDHTHDFGGFTLVSNISLYHNGGFYWEADNVLRQPAYSIVNASVTFSLASRPVSLQFWVQNLLGEKYYSSQQSGGGFPFSGGAGQPRTAGATISYNF